ncbi:hypothetical protein WA026_015405 [Henosepilachna vigintioctopunctata]|uniref:MYND-type domain-containing protein n=1 Tax=Henosepilachna vigintioctopunctata TaxID=420089 RepID=A0AAW1UMQ1_9CUCU
MCEILNDNDYSARCGEKTLQSESEGFFLTFADNLLEIAGKKWIEKRFGKMKEDKERLEILYEYEPVRNMISEVFSNIQELYRKKSSEVAYNCRKEAEAALREDNIMRSLALYSQSVLRSQTTGENMETDNGNSLSLALIGRSKVLMEIEKINYACTDILLALREGLPDIFKGEAYFRLAICYKALDEDKKADISFQVAKKLLNENEELLFKRYLNETSSTAKFRTLKKKKELPKISGKPSAVLPNAIDKLKVRSTSTFGRHIVSEGDIKTGDTLVVEKPEAACLIPKMFGSHCQNCLERLIAPIWCPTCSNVAFCSTQCKDQALASYHKYECKIMDLLHGSGLSVLSFLALRMVTQHDLEEQLNICENRQEEPIFKLCTNSEKRGSKDFFMRTTMAAFLLRCLQKTGYFNFTNDSVIPTEMELKVGAVLLFNLQMLQFNAHEVYEKIHPSSHRFKGSKINYIGVGVYPTVALFNHQCYPSVTRYFIGKNIIVNAIKPIHPGDIVAENYGPIFTKKPFLVRQKSLLARYWFKCECDACMQSWPMINCEEVSTRVRCPTKDCQNVFTFSLSKGQIFNCIRCKLEVNLKSSVKKIQWCEEQYMLGLKKMDDMKPYEGTEILKKALDTFHAISVPPHNPTHLAEETLRACYADLGNTFEVIVKRN